MKRKVLTILIFVFSCFLCFSQNKDGEILSLKQIDGYVKNTDYDRALYELSRYFDCYPERFDQVQKRVGKIINIRINYSIIANELLRVIREDPENTAKLGRLTAELVRLERNPYDTRLEIIKNTHTLALLANYSLIQNNSAVLVEKGKFSDAVSKSKEGFEMYEDQFYDRYKDKQIYKEVQSKLSDIDSLSLEFSEIIVHVENSVKNFINAVKAKNLSDTEKSYNQVKTNFESLARIRNGFANAGVFFDEEYKKSGSKKDDEANLYFHYAHDTVFGWQANPNCGILGSVDAFWNINVEKMKKEAELCILNLQETFEAENAKALGGESLEIWINNSNTIKTFADYGKKINALYSLLLQDDGKGNKSSYPNYDVSIDYAVFCAVSSERLNSRNQQIFELEKTAANLKLENEKTLNELEAFDAEAMSLNMRNISAGIEKVSEEIKADIPEASAPGIAYQKAKEKEFNARFIPSVKTAGVQIEDGLIDWKNYDKDVTILSENSILYASRLTSSIWKDISVYYKTFAESSLVKAETLLSSEKQKIHGIVYEDESVKRYPAKAKQEIEELKKYIAGTKKLVEASLAVLDGKYNSIYVEETTAINKVYARLSEIESEATADKASAEDLLRLAERAKNEAEVRLGQVRKFLKAENFENARKRLLEAGDKFVESLSYNDDSDLRSSSDKELQLLGEQIKEQENIVVVRDVRKFKTLARREYANGNFDMAEKYLNNAKNRWADTNVEEDDEIVNLMAMVDIASSMKNGRVLLPSDSLYPEMSQLLSSAIQLYKDGAALIKKGKTQEGIVQLDKSVEKLKEFRVVYPMNQEASLLSLRIQQVKNPEDFKILFEEKINTIKNEYKLEEKKQQCYSDLMDLYEINPDYPGIKGLIYNVEIEVGVRQKPVQKNDIAKSNNYVNDAKKIFQNAGRDKSKLNSALEKVNEAIRLNSDNQDAVVLKDEILIRMGGNVSVVLSSEDTAKYNRAIQELQKNNVIQANAIVEQLLQKSENKYSAKLLELEKRIKARIN